MHSDQLEPPAGLSRETKITLTYSFRAHLNATRRGKAAVKYSKSTQNKNCGWLCITWENSLLAEKTSLAVRHLSSNVRGGQTKSRRTTINAFKRGQQHKHVAWTNRVHDVHWSYFAPRHWMGFTANKFREVGQSKYQRFRSGSVSPPTITIQSRPPVNSVIRLVTSQPVPRGTQVRRKLFKIENDWVGTIACVQCVAAFPLITFQSLDSVCRVKKAELQRAPRPKRGRRPLNVHRLSVKGW